MKRIILVLVLLSFCVTLAGCGETISGIGKDAFGTGKDFDHQDDWFLKAVANIAMGDKEGDAVPAAGPEEMEMFRKARRHLPKCVFDEQRMKKAVAEPYWPHVVYVLNRGGRFEDSHKMHKGDKQAHPFKGTFFLFAENTAKHRNSMTGQFFDGLPKVEPQLLADGTPAPVPDEKYPLQLITYKEIFAGHSRTMAPNLWLKELMSENRILMNRRDGERLRIKDGDMLRLSSPSNPTGTIDLGNGTVLEIKGKARLIEGMKPGVIAISWHFGHWAYGSRDVEVDGHVVQGDPKRSTGIAPNPLMLEDDIVKDVCATDPIGGSASFFDTPVTVSPA